MPNVSDEITLIGETDFRQQKTKFGIKTNDRRMHCYVIGRTGSGKTTVEETLALYDVQHGRGVGIIDPHGEFSERVLKYVPKDRIKDVVYFNPADIDFPIAFNVMESVGFEMRHIVASSLLSVFKKIWPDVWSARMEYILNNTILALLEYPDSTLLGINRMLADKGFRDEVVAQLQDPIVKAFWSEEFAHYNDRYAQEATAAIQNKVGQFVSSPLIRNIIGQKKSKMNLRQIIDNHGVIIVRLPGGLIGETNSALLGGLIITKLQQAAMSRIDIPESERQDFFLFIDEFQNFATESFINILAEARKYRLNMTLAHQYIEQIPEEIRNAVLGTVGSMLVFRIGARDAKILESEFEPDITATDLVNVPKWKFYAKIVIDGVVSHPFLASTLAPQAAPAESFVSDIIESSRAMYANPRAQVDAEISTWMASMIQSNNAAPAENRTLFPGVCSLCGRSIEVPFPPDPRRPLYCQDCLKKVQRAKALGISPSALPKGPDAPPGDSPVQSQPVASPAPEYRMNTDRRDPRGFERRPYAPERRAGADRRAPRFPRPPQQHRPEPRVVQPLPAATQSQEEKPQETIIPERPARVEQPRRPRPPRDEEKAKQFKHDLAELLQQMTSGQNQVKNEPAVPVPEQTPPVPTDTQEKLKGATDSSLESNAAPAEHS